MSGKINNGVMLGGVAAAIAALGIGGYFYLANAGVEHFEDFLYENDLRDAVRYREIAYSPLTDTITLEDVDLELEPVPGRKLTGNLELLEFSAVSEEDALEVYFSGYPLVTDPTKEEIAENAIYQFAVEPLSMVHDMGGVDETLISGGVSLHYDKDDDRLFIAIELDARDIAGQSISLILDRAGKLARLRPSELEINSLADLQRLQDEFGRIELVSGNGVIRDHGFLKRLAYLMSLKTFSYDKALNADEVIFDPVAFRMADGSDINTSELNNTMEEDSLEALQHFLAKGGNLNIKLETERPVSFRNIEKGGKLNRDLRIELDT